MMSGIHIDPQVFPHAEDLHPIVFHLLRRIDKLLPSPHEDESLTPLPDYYERGDGEPVYVWNRDGLHTAVLWACRQVFGAFDICEKCGEDYFPATSLPRVITAARTILRGRGYANLNHFKGPDGNQHMDIQLRRVQRYYAQCGCAR